MATFNIYQRTAVETPLARKWFVRALIASIIIHAALFAAFRATKLESFTPAYTERLVPRNFSVGRVAVNEKLLSDEPEKPQDDPQSNTHAAPKIEIPKDSPAVDTNPPDVVFTPTALEAVKPIVTENPKVSDSDLKTLEKMQENVTKDLDKELNNVSEQLIKDKAHTTSKSVLKFADNTKAGAPGNPTATANGASAIPGMKSLDEALASTGGGLQNGDKIGIRGGALFEFDSADLRADAMPVLTKLALEMVKIYPKATLIINGYADSIGANINPQYNKDLSQRRADAVKDFLQTMGVDQSRLQAVGYGSTKFIDSPTYDPARKAQEQNNRRVEIEFTVPH